MNLNFNVFQEANSFSYFGNNSGLVFVQLKATYMKIHKLVPLTDQWNKIQLFLEKH